MARKSAKQDTARDLAVQAARIAADDMGEDIIILDLRGISPVTDYFVICTGTSNRQIRAMAEDIRLEAKQSGQPAWHVSGLESGDWVLLDFVDVVVHLFEQSKRNYYDLELIWGEAPRVEWRDIHSPQES